MNFNPLCHNQIQVEIVPYQLDCREFSFRWEAICLLNTLHKMFKVFKHNFTDVLSIVPLIVGTVFALRFKYLSVLSLRLISVDAVFITFGDSVSKVASKISCSPVFFSFNF